MDDRVAGAFLVLLAGGLGFIACHDGKKRIGDDSKAFLWGVFVAVCTMLNVLLGLAALFLYFLVIGTIFERQKLECQGCGKGIRPGDRFCRSCGFELKTAKLEQHKLRTRKYCPNCRSSYPFEDDFCPQCGTKLIEKTLTVIDRKAEGEIPPGMRECPNCKARVLEREQTCWKCGADLATGH